MNRQAKRPAAVWLGVFIAAAAARGESATRPATRPTVAGGGLPPGAVRRLGGRRFPVDGQARGPLAVSADGRRAAVADDGGASIWDLATGERTGVVRPDPSPGRLPFGAAYLPGDTLAVACADPPRAPRAGRVTLFLADPATGRVRRSIELADAGLPIDVHDPVDGPGVVMATTPDDFTASADGRHVAFRVGRRVTVGYDLVTGRLLSDPAPFPLDRPGRIASRPGPHRTFGGRGRGLDLDGTGSVTVFDTATMAGIGGRSFPADGMSGGAASVSADGKLLATVDRGQVHLYDLSDGTDRDRLPVALDSRPSAVAFAPTGGRLAVVSRGASGASLAVVDTAAAPPAVVATCAAAGRPFGAGVAWSGDGRVVAVPGVPAGVEAFDAGTGRPLSPRSDAGGPTMALAADPDGRTVATGDAFGAVRLWDLDTGRLRAERAVETRPNFPVADLFYDGPGLVVISSDQRQVVDPRSLASRGPVDRVDFDFDRPTAVSHDGRLQARADGPHVTVVDRATGRTLADVDAGIEGRTVVADRYVPAPSPQLAFSDDGRWVGAWTLGGFRLVDVLAGRAGPLVPVGNLKGLRFSPDGRRLAAIENQSVCLYSTEADGPTQPPRRLWSAPAAAGGRPLLFDETGAWVGVLALGLGGRPGTAVTVYESATGRAVLSIPIDRMDSPVCFVPHRPWYVTAQADGTALVWDVRTILGPVGPDRSDDQLWADLAGDDPAAAYRAGFALADRGRLAARAAAAGVVDDRARWRSLIARLAAADGRERESAHRQLERAGPAAATEVRRALAAHPGGEVEARLADLARLDAAPPAPAAEAPPEADRDAVRRERVLTLLDRCALPDRADPPGLPR